MKHLGSACLAILLAACGAAPEVANGTGPGGTSQETPAPAEERPEPPPTLDWTVTPRGAGPVRLGMSLDEAREALGNELIRHGVPGESCLHIDPGGSAPEGLLFMVVDERVVRVEVSRDSAAATSVGVHPGDSEALARERLGPATEVTPHQYVDGHYLKAPTGDGETFWVVETDNGRVTTLRVGFLPQVRWIEGCS